jgi:ATP-dependent Clp protease ATP-binding subunit ClpB
MQLQVTDAARDLLATLGYDPTFGARPLKRVIQKRVLDPLAMGLLNGTLHEGETVTLSVGEDGEFQLAGQMSEAPVVA